MKAATDKGTQTSLDKRLLKVLLVEDEATDRKSVQRILKTCSLPIEFVVEPAVSLSEAIGNLAEKKYDVVLLDLELPDSSGIETVREIVKVAPDIPVVVLTELNDEQTGFSALEDGATDYLVKDLPLDIVLVRTIVYALQRKKIQMQSLKLTHDINERMKELNCLYGISKLVEAPGISSEEIFEKTVCLIPAGWQYPGIACARIVFEGKEYKTDNFKPSKWTQSADITLQGQKVGTVEVCYMEERPQFDEGPFLGEKRDLIDAIGERLGKIAERIKAEEALRESEERYHLLFESSRDAMMTLMPPSWKFVLGNPAAFEMFGAKDAAEFTSLGPWDVSPEWQPDGRPSADKAREMIETAMREGFHFFEWTHKRLGGENFSSTVLLTSMEMAGQKLIQATVRDITEEGLILDANWRLEKVSEKLSAAKRDLEQKNESLQKAGSELEQRVKERTVELAAANKVLGVARQNMHTVIKHSADGLLIVDDNKIVRFMNPAAEVIFGRGTLDLLGEPFGLPLTTDKPSEVQLVAADGSVTTTEVQAVRTEWENEPVYLATVRDITLRKKAQQETEAANEQLRKFNDLKDEFVSMASHELRTPLSVIIGAVKLVLDQIPGKIVPEQKEVLETAMNNLSRLTRIVDALLDISKIESGKIELHKANIDIRGLIEETVGECCRQAEEKGIHLGFRVPEQPVDLCIDGDKIKQVLMNLISNGLKFTPAGGSIEVECKAEQKEVQLSVSDTGCGVAEQDMPRLFEKFAQFGRKVGPGEKGTGLGLAICRGMVELHKGRIWAKSQQGKGTVFTFALPWLDSRDIVSELLEQAVRQAVKNNANAGVIVMSAKAKGQEGNGQVQRVLKEVQVLVEQNLRRGVDKTVLRNPDDLVVVLTDCDKSDAAAIKTRLEQTLTQYLVDKNLHSQMEPLIRCAIYPQDGHTTEELLEKVNWTDMVGSASSSP
jgi:PAS domain S-box-containing protein